jgi:gamma-glutamylputrescine oxidase
MPVLIQQSYWEKTTSPGSFPAPENLPRKTDILIIGAGLAGSWLAYFLKKQNPALEITLVERDSLGRGASTKNAGFLSGGNLSEWRDDIEAAGFEKCLETLLARMEGVQIVKDEFGNSLDIKDCGSADFDEFTDETNKLMGDFNKGLKAHGLPLYSLKEMNLGHKQQTVTFHPAGAAINPVQLLSSLHSSLVKNGVRLFFGMNAESVNDGTAHLAGQDGKHHDLEYGYGYICINAFARDLVPASLIEPARGQVIVTKPCDIARLPRLLGFRNYGYDYFRPVGNNRALLGGGRHLFRKDEAVASFETTEPVRAYLEQNLRELLGHAEFEIDTHWAGIMGMRGGGHVTVDQLLKRDIIDVRTETIGGFSGWGVTLTPYIARQRAGI